MDSHLQSLFVKTAERYLYDIFWFFPEAVIYARQKIRANYHCNAISHLHHYESNMLRHHEKNLEQCNWK